MKRFIVFLLLCASTLAQQPATKPVKKPVLITSDLNGRDMLFIAQAIDHGKTLSFLATSATKTTNPELRGFSSGLVKTITGQGVVLSSLAEMRKVRVTEGESITAKKYSERFRKLEGPKLDKAILDAFIETDERVVMIYELAEKSTDPTIREFVSQTLPQLREHLVFVQNLAGISPNRTPTPAEPEKKLESAPGVLDFRTNGAK